MYDIVAIDKGYVFPTRRLKPFIAGSRGTSIRLMKHRDTRIAAGIVIANVPAPIGRTIIDDDDLDVAIGLRQHRVKASGEVGYRVKYRYNNGYQLTINN
jgi:hypothetical protein